MVDKRLVPLLLLFLSAPALAEFSFEYDFDAHVKPWKEIQASLPAAPKAGDLVPLDLGPATHNRFSVDRASVSVGPDRVVRYTVVIRTEGGARNVDYEGMRCATAEQKIYAFGRADGKWSRNDYARWAPIRFHGPNDYQGELFQHYFCTVGGAADMTVIRRALAGGGIGGGYGHE